MSFESLIQGLKDNPALADELKAAATPAERAAILDAHGIEQPAPDAELPEVSGGSAEPLPPGFDPSMFGGPKSGITERAQGRPVKRPGGF